MAPSNNLCLKPHLSMSKKNYFIKWLGMLACIIISTNLSIAQHQKYYADPDTAIQHQLENWRDLKFGLLMHWGTYSQWGIVESWSICPEDLGWATGARKQGVADNYYDYLQKYEALKTTFNPVHFAPQKWAAAAKDAGMKYVIFTTKHHDGFCMFDTKYSNYKITADDCPFSKNEKSNVAKEIFSAFRNEGLWTGAYFSKPDWHSDFYWWKQFPPVDRNANYSIKKHPDQWQKFVNYTHNQIKELVGGDYGKIDILWLDGGWVRVKTDKEVEETLNETDNGNRWARNPQSQDINMPLLVKEVRALQPKILVVDRDVPGEQQNYLTPEQTIPNEILPYPWETCMTMGNSWSYVPGDIYKPADELIKKLVDIVSKGGNFLLNIGPGPGGDFSDTAYTRLKEIGQWMKVNSEGIYATRPCATFGEGNDIRFTQSKDGKTNYIFLFAFPQDGIVITKLNFLPNAQVSLLGYNKSVKWKSSTKGIEIKLPAAAKPASDYVWVLKVKN
jgi:Alpha-L-fucosidase